MPQEIWGMYLYLKKVICCSPEIQINWCPVFSLATLLRKYTESILPVSPLRPELPLKTENCSLTKHPQASPAWSLMNGEVKREKSQERNEAGTSRGQWKRKRPQRMLESLFL